MLTRTQLPGFNWSDSTTNHRGDNIVRNYAQMMPPEIQVSFDNNSGFMAPPPSQPLPPPHPQVHPQHAQQQHQQSQGMQGMQSFYQASAIQDPLPVFPTGHQQGMGHASQVHPGYHQPLQNQGQQNQYRYQ